MPQLISPYRPGFGERPAVLVGRDRQLARADAILARLAATQRQVTAALILVGPRGLGKTVTLDLIRERAQDQRFVAASARFDAESNNTQRLASAVAQAVAPLHRTGHLWDQFTQRLAGLEIEVNAGIVKVAKKLPDTTQSEGDSQRDSLTSVLTSASLLAADHDRAGLTIHIDELQAASPGDLSVLANAIQDSLAEPGAPFAVFAAGLPNTPAKVTAAASFAERFDYRALDPLSRDEATVALVQPAAAEQVRWDAGALDAVLDAAGGSPYLLQRMGDEIWEIAAPDRGDTITTEHVTRGLDDVAESLGTGMFTGRFDKATRVEREVMTAMSQVVDHEGVARTSDIALITGRTNQALGPVRQQLIDKGLVDTPARGELRFTMAGFDQFVRDKTDTPHLSRAQLDELAKARRQDRTQHTAKTIIAARQQLETDQTRPPAQIEHRQHRRDDQQRPPEADGPTPR